MQALPTPTKAGAHQAPPPPLSSPSYPPPTISIRCTEFLPDSSLKPALVPPHQPRCPSPAPKTLTNQQRIFLKRPRADWSREQVTHLSWDRGTPPRWG